MGVGGLPWVVGGSRQSNQVHTHHPTLGSQFPAQPVGWLAPGFMVHSLEAEYGGCGGQVMPKSTGQSSGRVREGCPGLLPSTGYALGQDSLLIL